MATAPAVAALSGTMTVQLLAPGGIVDDPTPIALADNLPATSGALLAPGDGSAIGSFMLPLESIALDDQTFQLRVATGAVVGGQFVTGYLGSGAEHARYEFSGLAVPGMKITGLLLGSFDGFTAAGFSGLTSPTDLTQAIRLTSASSFSVDLDGLTFADRGTGESNAYADLRIELLTAPVPEPAAGWLAVAGLALLIGRQRRTHAPR